MATLEVKNVVKCFGSVTAVDDFSLFVNEGEFVTLLGPSGCGKTTLLNIIAGLEEVTSGKILINGKVVNDLGPFERDVAMVFQNYALYPHMTVAENIGFSMKLRRRAKKEIQTRVNEVAKMLELEHLLARLPRELSGGQQQRVAIGRAVIREPAIFLFDEPFSNLDAALRMKTRGEIKELHQHLGVTSIFVTHDQEEALSLSDHVAVLRLGRLEQYGSPEEIYSKPASKYVARFIGSPQIDIFEGQVEQQDGRLAYRIGEALIDLPANLQPPDRPLDLAIRSEHVHLGERGFPAAVRLVQPVGPFTYV
ncbi:MAG TPA: ABC transporter ATP-binding protein, partial [Anaerolineaceae bacterium]|nr:ABC transporter ATP-binding protein [Anaerolineaceae bacterium]